MLSSPCPWAYWSTSPQSEGKCLLKPGWNWVFFFVSLLFIIVALWAKKRGLVFQILYLEEAHLGKITFALGIWRPAGNSYWHCHSRPMSGAKGQRQLIHNLDSFFWHLGHSQEIKKCRRGYFPKTQQNHSKNGTFDQGRSGYKSATKVTQE